ncbi:unnamed protein product [Rotaria sp. Silwood1]|nr:unnamed protein product [Rotaria sp. Silwood1]CAF4762489.1 unnamed protein product [Rotaria sp. Silwood1]
MKKKLLITTISFLITLVTTAQSPSLSAWLRNSTITARHYDKTTGALISDASLANVQSVKYTSTDVYISTTGLPAYITGPFLDGNTNVAGNQNAIFKFPLTPTKNTGTPTATTAGNIGIFINGVALFDYRDGVSWNNSQSKVCGGPIMGCTGDGLWNRDAVVGERLGFDCAKGHPAGTNYHHHQNPSAFNLDLNVISTICNLYSADGLYVINSSQHSPLIGFAYDGFPIYGAYAYKDTNGTGVITRMKSSYALRNITTRTSGPAVSTTYPLGYFKEDYEFITPTSTDYLDEHNGRFCKTPEYPNGTYCYFATVDVNHNSAYPYVVGPTFYGNKVVTKVATIPGGATTYTGPILFVESIDINGYLNDKGTVLNWTTTNEKDVKYFAIESSNDGISFSKVGEVASNGNSNNKYSFTDWGTFINTKYYRIKIVDVNGKYAYSKVISFYQNKTIDIGIFPNPVADLLIMQANGIVKNSMEITLANAMGQIIKKQQFLQGSTICYVETRDLTNGVYFVSVNEGINKKVYKIIIQH